MVGADVLAERERRQLQSQPELNPAHHALGDRPREPVDQSERRNQEHRDADGEARAVDRVGGDVLRDHERRDRLEWLDRHREAVRQPGEELHGAVGDEDAGRVEMGGEHHAHDERQVRAEVPERSRELVAVEADGGRTHGAARRVTLTPSSSTDGVLRAPYQRRSLPNPAMRCNRS